VEHHIITRYAFFHHYHANTSVTESQLHLNNHTNPENRNEEDEKIPLQFFKGEIAISPFKNAHFAKTRHCALKNKWHFTVIAITPVFIIVNSNS
jgi:hypothetical protein